ncbi:MAG: hypothetical protein WC208_16655, partial [Gallionella sp.]
MDYANLFGGGGGFSADPSLAIAPTAAVPSAFSEIFGSPDKLALIASMVGRLGSSLSNPGSPGDVLGKAAGVMAQAGAVNRAANAPSTATPTPAPATAVAGNPLDTAKGYSKLGSMLKDAFAIDPSLVPENYKENFASALSTNPNEVLANPTVPANASPAPATAGVQPLVRTLPAALAMTMTPEQVQASQAQDLARSAEGRALALNPVDIAERQARTAHYGDLREYQKWQMDPARVEE